MSRSAGVDRGLSAMASSVHRVPPRVGVVTIVDLDNYGNRLQNYATQHVLEGLGTHPETLLFQDRHAPQSRARRSVPDLFATLVELGPRAVTERVRGRVQNRRRAHVRAARRAKMLAFTERHLRELQVPSTEPADGGHWHDAFERIVVGSDQVWNPNRRAHFGEAFATFAPPEKRVAYAASFGVSQLPPELRDTYARGLHGMARLSVRESEGARLVKELVGADADVLVDPTLMLTEAHWSALCRPHRARSSEPYVAAYFLGGADRRRAAAVSDFARERAWQVVRLADPSAAAAYDADPAEFLDYIRSAEAVITDSYHALLFSIIFGRQAIVVGRLGGAPSMRSRFDTLFSTLDLTPVAVEGYAEPHRGVAPWQGSLASVLERERQRARAYLGASLG